ncbi:inactive cell surface hyaluronidase CEMIP2-like isoform X3 [Rhineura floridana]|uniref:inactive cell surface hyaluronidase CEMIP2-like isoform X3 n=1 Tax=Rhineura floridana TaxID=261503 RepID=UPI002AC84C2F|nr:inactive cell surface hyaluronidase CEMIP2-like isoform X3 [Rhineura floridana]
MLRRRADPPGFPWPPAAFSLFRPSKKPLPSAATALRRASFLPFGLSKSPSLWQERRSEKLPCQTTLPHLKVQADHHVPVSGLLALTSFLLLLSACSPARCLQNSPHLNSSLWDTDCKELFQRILPGAPESHKLMDLLGSNSPLSLEEQKQLLTNQNLTAKMEGEPGTCDLLLKFSRHVLAKAFGPSLAADLVERQTCDHPDDPPQLRLHPQKRLHSKIKPLSLHWVCQLLRNMGVVVEMNQSKMPSLLRKRMLATRKPLAKTEVKHNGSHCPSPAAHFVPWRPGHNSTYAAVVGRGTALRLETSATFHSLLIQEGGILVFADDPEQPITLRARSILLEDGGALYVGSECCPYRSKAIISLYGKSTEGADVEGYGKKFLGVGRGGILELHGRKPRSWTPLVKTLYPGGLRYGSYASEKHWSSRGLNVRIVDVGTAQVVAAERFDTHLLVDESRRLREFLAHQAPGNVIAVAVGDSAAKSLTLETRHFLRSLLHSKYIQHLQYRQPWVLVGILSGDASSITEDAKPSQGNGTRWMATATKEFKTYDGIAFRVTAYSGWIKGVPHHGFKVEVSKGIVLDLVDDVTSWLPGDKVVVASTDYSMHQAEEFNLLPCPECQRNQVKIDGSPLYLHMGEIVDGVDMRAEVGLLTRNILIQGEMEDSCYGLNHCQFFSFDTFGGQIKIQKGFASVHMAGVELKNMGQQILGSYPVHFHLTGDVDERGGYNPPSYLDNLAIHHCFSRCVAVHGANGLLVKDTIGYDTLGHCFFLEDGTEQRNTFHHNLGLLTKAGTILPTDRNEAMCLAIRENVYGGYVPVPSMDCMAVSSFWIANPNNNLVENAAAGAQDVGIWYIFHRVPTGQSEGQYPAGQSELTPLGTFYNNRVHSNFKAGLFIGKGVKTTKASAENPREYLTVDNARFRPHQDADPKKPRIPAVIDGLIAFKNNDHGAWARGGDIVFRNCGFADNGIGLTLASDGTFPIDEGCSLEVTHSVFVGESNNVGSRGGQNSYWGRGANGEYRTLPRNKTFPIRGFQIYDGPVRLTKCTFRKFTPTADRHASAIGFFMKNAWQISPQNNASLIRMERSVGLKVFLGRPGQWFGDNNNDGDKVSIFHDLDGSVTGYPGTFVGRADNYLIRHPGCLIVPRWNGMICAGKYAQLYIQARRPENLTLSIARAAYHSHPLRLQGVNRGVPYQQYQPVVMLEQGYIIQWDGRAPEDVVLYPVNFNRYLFVHLQAHEIRKGHSYCTQHGCERLKITAVMSSRLPWSCAPNPFLGKDIGRKPFQPSRIQRQVVPCSQCGAPWVAVTSTPSIRYVWIQIQSVRRADLENYSRLAFVKVNSDLFLFHNRGILFLVLDACSGAVVSRQPFDAGSTSKVASAITDYVETTVKERSIVLICTRDPAEAMGTSEMSVFTRLGSAKSIAFHKKGSFAMLGYKGTPKPYWIKIHNQAADQKSASLQYYVPLMLREYGCSVNATKPQDFVGDGTTPQRQENQHN